MVGEHDDLELKDLDQFSGTEEYHNVMGVNVTDGVAYVMQNGYSWFVTDMLVIVLHNQAVKNEEFLVVNLKVANKKALAVIEDGNGKVLHRQKYDYTDAKKDLTLYFECSVLMLANER